jgi:hypothetical protein
MAATTSGGITPALSDGHGAGHFRVDGGDCTVRADRGEPGWATSARRTSSFAYDAATGLLTQEVVEPGTPALRRKTDTAYDAFGNKTSVTVRGIDIVTRSSATAYDTKGEFATSNTNALSQSERALSTIPGSASRPGIPVRTASPPPGATTVCGRKTQEAGGDPRQPLAGGADDHVFFGQP